LLTCTAYATVAFPVKGAYIQANANRRVSMQDHKDITGVRDVSGGPFLMCLEGDRVYFEGGALDLDGLAQLVAAVDGCVRQIREADRG
jgi:hypothetical protein